MVSLIIIFIVIDIINAHSLLCVIVIIWTYFNCSYFIFVIAVYSEGNDELWIMIGVIMYYSTAVEMIQWCQLIYIYSCNNCVSVAQEAVQLELCIKPYINLEYWCEFSYYSQNKRKNIQWRKKKLECCIITKNVYSSYLLTLSFVLH